MAVITCNVTKMGFAVFQQLLVYYCHTYFIHIVVVFSQNSHIICHGNEWNTHKNALDF